MKQLVLFIVSVVLGPALVAQADTYSVINANDDGPGSLRAALTSANDRLGPDVINFRIPGAGVHTITLASPLPWVVDGVLIDGYTQPGSSPNSLIFGNNATLRIEINGANAGPGVDGLFILAPDCTVRGIILNRFSGSGVRVMMVFNCTIAGNFIGTDPTGSIDRGNAQHGVWLERAIDCRVGGTARADRNLISGNDRCGVAINGFDGSGNLVQGNFIGTTAAGTLALPNAEGVCVFDCPGNLIGGMPLGAGNLISGNATNGVLLRGALTTGSLVQGNFIGTAPGGSFAVPNGTGVRIDDAVGVGIGGTVAGARNVISGNRAAGVALTGAASSGNRVEGNWIGPDGSGNLPLGNGGDGVLISAARGNSIGGNVAGAGNVISANAGAGIDLLGATAASNRVERNFIGTARDGASPLGNRGAGVLLSLGAHHNFIGGNPVAQVNNTMAFNAAGVLLAPTAGVGNAILGNSIFSNTGLGIDLGDNGVTANDPADADPGPNRLQNFPVILLGYTIDQHTVVIASLHSVPSNTFRIEFFASSEPDPTGYGEGQIFLGSCLVATDAAGNTTFTFFAEWTAPAGSFLTATATDLDGSTSEFSLASPNATPPVIVQQPVSQSVPLHDSVSFSVVAEGTAPLTYQWYFNGAPLPHETNAVLFLPDALPATEGAYQVIVDNPLGVATSLPALLTVQQPAMIVMQPVGMTVDPGGSAELCVTAVGNGSIQYQWRLNGLNIPDETNRCIQFPEFLLAQAGTYSVVVASPVNLVESDLTPVPLNGVPVLDGGDDFAGRVALTRSVGMIASSNALATVEEGEPDHAGKPGGHSLWYCWLAPSNGVVTFRTVGSGFDTLLSIYTGTNLSSLVPASGDDDRSGFLTSEVRFNARGGEKYQIAVDGFAGETGRFILSWELDTTRPPLPEISSQPRSVTVREGQPAGFSVFVSGEELDYQWFFNGQALEFETGPSLFISNVGPAHVGGYSVRVFGSGGFEGGVSVDSQVAQLEIGPVPYIQSTDKLPELVFAQAPSGDEGRAAGPGGSSLVGGFVPVTQGTPDYQVMNNLTAGHSIFESNHCNVIGGGSKWFGLVPATAGIMVLDTFGSTFDTVVAVYTGITNYTDPSEFWARLRPLTCNDNVPGTNVSQVCFNARAGTNYFVAVDGRDGARGTVRLNWRLLSPPPLLAGSANKQLVRMGSDITLRAYTSNVPSSVSYQWTWQGTNLPGATNNSLFLCNLQLGHAGEYNAIVVSNTMSIPRSRARLVVGRLNQRLFSSAGSLRFQVTGLASERVALDRTTNIFQWTPVSSNTAPTSTDTAPLARPERYFRLRTLP